jgi:hypothetical protein
VASAEVNEGDFPPPLRSAAAKVAAPPIHLEESKLFVQLGGTGEGERARWILDIGATNHMTAARYAFSNLDTGVRGTVRFGDGSVVDIEGRNTILFACKNGEHQALAGMYLIPKMTVNIVSLGQLEEDGYKVLMENDFLRICDQRRRLLAKVPRAPNCLYILNLNIDKPVCLAARSSEAAWRWHAWYGHLGFQGLRLLARKEMVRGLPPIEQVEQVCHGCMAGVNTKNWYTEETDLWAKIGRRAPFGKRFSSKHSVKASTVGNTPSFGRRAVSRLEEEAFGSA